MAPKDVIEVLRDRHNIPFDVIKYVIFPLLYEKTNKVVKQNKRNFKKCIAQIEVFGYSQWFKYEERCIDKGEYNIVHVHQYLARMVWIREPSYIYQRAISLRNAINIVNNKK